MHQPEAGKPEGRMSQIRERAQGDSLPLESNEAQILLAIRAYPDDQRPMERWIADGMSQLYRRYVEDPARQGETVPLDDEAAQDALLQHIRMLGIN